MRKNIFFFQFEEKIDEIQTALAVAVSFDSFAVVGDLIGLLVDKEGVHDFNLNEPLKNLIHREDFKILVTVSDEDDTSLVLAIVNSHDVILASLSIDLEGMDKLIKSDSTQWKLVTGKKSIKVIHSFVGGGADGTRA